ncbi:MAG: hypothetical protein AB1585_02975 [Thermodesulfobacteriota bacterium]
MKKVKSLTILVVVLVMFSSVCGAAAAKKSTCPAGLAGTWVGGAGSDIGWFATQTSDSLDPTKGEMLMNWTYIKPNFIGGSASEFTLTPGHGVWQLNAEGNYGYTWYAYALSRIDGSIAGIVRVSGVAMLKDFNDPTVTNCDTVLIYYNFDMATGAVLPTDLATATFQEGPKGWAVEVRVPMTVTPLPLQ